MEGWAQFGGGGKFLANLFIVTFINLSLTFTNSTFIKDAKFNLFTRWLFYLEEEEEEQEGGWGWGRG